MLDFINFLLRQQNPACPPVPHPDSAPNAEDQTWLNSDLSNLGAYEPYEWADGELEQGKLIDYILGKGLVIEE